ncbi:hypothetical protein V8E54_010230 [Elaphomyces granulatus]
MPHTPRRRKLPLRKRIEVADEDGWTHITTSGVSAHRAIQARDYKLLPAEPPLGLTIGELKKQYETHRQRWRSSSAGDALDSVLRSRAASSVGGIDRIICIGLGSLSGFVGGGWVDRRSVSLYQLAALESVIEFLAGPSIDATIKQVLAQDPVFNDLDKELLHFLGITVVDHPAAFDLVNDQTFLYCPGAEILHLTRLLPYNPALLLGGPLENVSSENGVLAAFVQTRNSLQLPPFEQNQHAFWNTRLYWKEDAHRSQNVPCEGV